MSGGALPLRVLEFRLLVYLARRAGTPASVEEILEALFESRGHRAGGRDHSRAPAMAISRLRQKLGAASHHLVTVPGFGFTLDPNPTHDK